MSNPILEKAVKTFGKDAQIGQTTEELAELIVRLNKYKRSDYSPEERIRIIEEIADVQIMIEQLIIILGKGTTEIEIGSIKGEKLRRLANMIEVKK